MSRARPRLPQERKATDDIIAGTDGNDVIRGHYGKDTITGGAGDDWISSGPGADLMTGGLGSDTFNYISNFGALPAEPDTITDFTLGADRIELTLHARSLVNVAGVIDLTPAYIGDAPFSHTQGEVRLENEQLQFDFNADGVTDMLIIVLGVTAMSQSDFI